MRKPAQKPRNNSFVDMWSFIHLFNSVILCLLLGPGIAFAIAVLWEPLEIFIISPLVAKLGITFGHETIRNSLSDIVFDAIGVAIGILILKTF